MCIRDRSLGDFIWGRGIEYFDLNAVDDVSKLPDCRHDDTLVPTFLHTRKSGVPMKRGLKNGSARMPPVLRLSRIHI